MMKKRFTAALLTAVLCCLLAAPALAATYATVVGGWLRLRAYPSYQALIIASYKTGSVVTVLSKKDGWARVLTSDYRLGYMDQRFLYFGGTAPDPDPDPAPKPRTWTTVNRKAYVTSQNGKGVRLRSAPEVNKYNVMGLYPVGRTVKEIKVSNDGWSYIRIDGKYGYMMSQFLTTYSVPSPPSDPEDKPKPPKPPKDPEDPSESTLTGVEINKTHPKSGDKLKLTVTPSDVKYTAVWFRADTKILLSTAKTYTCTDEDVGHKITVRVTGSDGSTKEVTTHTVMAASASKPGSSEESSESESETESEKKPKPETETEPETKPETEPEKKPETEPETKPEEEGESGSKPDSKPGKKPSQKPDQKPDQDEKPAESEEGSET